MVSGIISRVVILVFGTLYPAYASYKAVKTKNVKEYVKWMMYWIVFALFTTVETFADVLISWFPFYYELKIVFVIWLLSPATKGSSILYRKFVHPELLKREQEIDTTLDKVKSQGYSALVNVGQQGLNFAVQSAVTGQNRMMDHLMKKSFSMGDISKQQGNAAPVTYKPIDLIEEVDEPDYGTQPHDVQGPSDNYQPLQEGGVPGAGANVTPHEYHGEMNPMPGTRSRPYNHNEGKLDQVKETKKPTRQLRSKSCSKARPRSRSAGRRRVTKKV